MNGQSSRLWGVRFTANGTRSVSTSDQLWILADNVEVATRKAKRFLKKDGAINIHIKAVIQHGTIDAF